MQSVNTIPPQTIKILHNIIKNDLLECSNNDSPLDLVQKYHRLEQSLKLVYQVLKEYKEVDNESK